MPDLPQFDATAADRGLQTNNIGEQATAQEGYRVGRFYHDTGQEIGSDVARLGEQYQAHVTFQQQSAGLATAAANHNQFVQAFDQVLKDPSIDKQDPAIMTRTMAAYDAAQQKWLEGFTTDAGKKWAVEHASSERESFQHYAIGALSHATGLAALDNMDAAREQSSAAAYTDPASAIETAKRYESSASGGLAAANMDFDTAAQIQPHIREGAQQIGYSGMLGAIEKSDDPVAAYHTFMNQDGAAELVGSKAAELSDYAVRQKEAIATDQLRQRALAKDQAEDVSTAAAGEWLTKLANVNTNDQNAQERITSQILADPRMLPATRDATVGMLSRLYSEHAETIDRGNPDALHQIITGITAGRTPSDAQILSSVGTPGGLSQSQADFAMRFAHPKTEHNEFETKMLDTDMGVWRAQYPPKNIAGMPDPANEQAYKAATDFYLGAIQSGQQRGVPLGDLLAPPGNDHPNSIYNLRSLDSFGPSPQGHANAAAAAHPGEPQTNLLDMVTGAWRNFVAATSGGAVAETPITGAPVVAPAYNPPPARAGAPSMNDLWSGT